MGGQERLIFSYLKKYSQRVFALNDFLQKTCFFHHFDPNFMDRRFWPLILGGLLFSFHMARFEQPPLRSGLICHLRHFLSVKIITGWWTGEQRCVWWSKSEIWGMTTRTQNHQLKRCCSSKRAIIHQQITKSNYFEDFWSKW